MQLSVVIVNYNVCHFLEQCLMSVKKAISSIEGEVFVVDNNSVDGSVVMVKEKFPFVKLIESKKNLGFSKGNNLAIKESKGKYVLLLNPDTIVQEDTFIKCIEYMDKNPSAGGLGVKMIDGTGKFLPESKRGLPTPLVAFYKIFGLSALFPKSQVFGKYHLGYLSDEKIAEVEVLSGAYMFMRKETLDKVGLLDETFFMYGEDIDLSYRINLGGYKNIYFPETRIIHYKGESTKKTSVNYVFIFYKAMIIFAQKHFSQKNAGIFSLLINMAIWLRAGMAIFARFIKEVLHPSIDSALIYLGMLPLVDFWVANFRPPNFEYPKSFFVYIIPFWILTWVLNVYFNLGYEKRVKPYRIFRGVFVGTIIIAVLSNFIDLLRYSKGLMVIGTIWSLFVMLSTKLVYHYFKYRKFTLTGVAKTKVVIVGDELESLKIIDTLKLNNPNLNPIGFCSYQSISNNKYYLGHVNQLDELIEIYHIEEIIFCSGFFSSHQIIDLIVKTHHAHLNYKIVAEGGEYIVGSNSKNLPGDYYTLTLDFNIVKSENRRNKRILDVLITMFVILILPFYILFVKKSNSILRNVKDVIIGKKTWVSVGTQMSVKIPYLKPGIIQPDILVDQISPLEYVKNYTPYLDLKIFFTKISRWSQ